MIDQSSIEHCVVVVVRYMSQIGSYPSPTLIWVELHKRLALSLKDVEEACEELEKRGILTRVPHYMVTH